MARPSPSIREELPGDEAAIRDLTDAAFADMPYSGGNEAEIIDILRRDGDLSLSLVAVVDERIVGHVGFSPLTGPETQIKGWFGLGPVSVAPDRQRLGIGKTLINAGLSHLRTAGAKGCALIGDPNYYQRFGFQSNGKLSYRDLAPEFVQQISFSGDTLTGKLKFSPGLEI